LLDKKSFLQTISSFLNETSFLTFSKLRNESPYFSIPIFLGQKLLLRKNGTVAHWWKIKTIKSLWKVHCLQVLLLKYSYSFFLIDVKFFTKTYPMSDQNNSLLVGLKIGTVFEHLTHSLFSLKVISINEIWVQSDIKMIL